MDFTLSRSFITKIYYYLLRDCLYEALIFTLLILLITTCYYPLPRAIYLCSEDSNSQGWDLLLQGFTICGALFLSQGLSCCGNLLSTMGLLRLSLAAGILYQLWDTLITSTQGYRYRTTVTFLLCKEILTGYLTLLAAQPSFKRWHYYLHSDK